MIRAVGTAVALAGLALLVGHSHVGTASAPERVELSGSFQLVDQTTCAFPITMRLDFHVAGTDLRARDGSLRQRLIRVRLDGTESANGVTLRETARYSIHQAPDETQRLVGLMMHARLPDGGLVTRDAGVIVRAPDGSIELVRGPHPMLLGDAEAYCAAFG